MLPPHPCITCDRFAGLPRQKSAVIPIGIASAKVASARKSCKAQGGEPSKIGDEPSFLADELYAAVQRSRLREEADDFASGQRGKTICPDR